jgi:5-methylcytosine-specific restriction endonuclease McrA
LPSAHRRQYLREYQRRWVAARRRQFFSNKVCACCGATYTGAGSLELDHTDPRLKVDHKIWSWSVERQDIELTKCQVLCKSCHRAKTSLENQRRKRLVGREGTKWCAAHQAFLPLSQFNRNRSHWTGFAPDCRSCANKPSRRGRVGKAGKPSSLENCGGSV